MQTDEATGEVVVASGDWDEYRVRIVSRNTFPTAAGLASSAAGLACLSEYRHMYGSCFSTWIFRALGVPREIHGK